MWCELDLNSMDDNKLAQLAWDLYIAACDDPSNFINFWWVKTLDSVLDSDADRIEVKVQNRAAVSWASNVPTFNIEFLETVDVEKIAMLYNLSVTTVAWTPVTDYNETISSWDATDQVGYPLEFKNWDLTQVTVDSITGSVDWLLTVDDDYTLSTNLIWETIVTFDVTWWTILTTIEQDFTVVYDYTPAAHSKISYERKYNWDRKFRAFILTETNADGKFNEISLQPCIWKWQYTLDIADLATAWDLKWTTWVFEGQRGSKIEYKVQTITE